MPNVIGLSAEYETNLRQLAAYLMSGRLKAEFNMGQFDDEQLDCPPTCGTVGCALGHGPYAGFPKLQCEKWEEYGERVYGLAEWLPGSGINHQWDWCFSPHWDVTDNSPTGAAKRILWLLDRGLPDDWDEQLNELAPLCYLDHAEAGQ